MNQIVRNFPWKTVFPFSKKPTAKGFVHVGSYETSGPMLTRKQNECPTLLTEQSCQVANSQSISKLKTYNFLENIPKKIEIELKKTLNNGYLYLYLPVPERNHLQMLMLLPSYTRKKPLLTPQTFTKRVLSSKKGFLLSDFCMCSKAFLET